MKDVLCLEIECPDIPYARTIKDYLIILLEKLWCEQECFDGKRPFGNSGWSYDLYPALIKAGLVQGKIDEYGYIEDIDQVEAHKIIREAIVQLRTGATK